MYKNSFKMHVKPRRSESPWRRPEPPRRRPEAPWRRPEPPWRRPGRFPILEAILDPFKIVSMLSYVEK